MSLYDALTTDDGAGVDAGTLGAFSLGLVATAVGGALSELINTLFSVFVIEPLDQLAGFAQVLYGFYGLPGTAFGVAFDTSETWVRGFGWLAFPVATIFVVLTAYIVVSGWSLNE